MKSSPETPDANDASSESSSRVKKKKLKNAKKCKKKRRLEYWERFKICLSCLYKVSRCKCDTELEMSKVDWKPLKNDPQLTYSPFETTNIVPSLATYSEIELLVPEEVNKFNGPCDVTNFVTEYRKRYCQWEE
ncbi:hypothetical protein GCK72_015392 [Caenorhabditis remanei]|uniref:Uncharacterized protein n=1 Tax=Caenorhabditis remanei TaxID=31234 RepID=A0A6A5GX56_CAERE|nr:hypothetical protein GCK72_015392 [Caenorhabditis remanei]KAF1758932.1 hypothetical protein GCK72_015392 [Caenorhabditis remanei]